MVKIRIWGTKEEDYAVVDAIQNQLELLSVSPAYKDRAGTLCRVYVEADLLPSSASASAPQPKAEPAKPTKKRSTTRKKNPDIPTHFSFDDLHVQPKTLPKPDHVSAALLHPEEHKTPKYKPVKHTKIHALDEYGYYAYDGDVTEKELPCKPQVQVDKGLAWFDDRVNKILRKNPACRNQYDASSKDIQAAADEIADLLGVKSFPFSIAKKLLWFGKSDADLLPREWKFMLDTKDLDFVKRYEEAVKKYRYEVFSDEW